MTIAVGAIRSAMAQALIRQIAEAPFEALKQAAKSGGEPLEAVLRRLIEGAGRDLLKEQAISEAAKLRAELSRRWAEEDLSPDVDTAALVREGREENDLKWT